MPFKHDPEAPLDPQTEADLRALAELIIADAVMHVLGNHNDPGLDGLQALDADERDALAAEVEAEVDAMFATRECPGCGHVVSAPCGADDCPLDSEEQ